MLTKSLSSCVVLHYYYLGKSQLNKVLQPQLFQFYIRCSLGCPTKVYLYLPTNIRNTDHSKVYINILSFQLFIELLKCSYNDEILLLSRKHTINFGCFAGREVSQNEY
jgi:hypothetical protein